VLRGRGRPPEQPRERSVRVRRLADRIVAAVEAMRRDFLDELRLVRLVESALLRETFDPDQPRDEDGRWEGGGGRIDVSSMNMGDEDENGAEGASQVAMATFPTKSGGAVDLKAAGAILRSWPEAIPNLVNSEHSSPAHAAAIAQVLNDHTNGRFEAEGTGVYYLGQRSREALREAVSRTHPLTADSTRAVDEVDGQQLQFELETALGVELGDAVLAAARELDLDLTFDFVPSNALKWLRDHAADFAASVAHGEREAVLEAIKTSLEEGTGPRGLGDALKNLFSEGIHRIDKAGKPFVVPLEDWAATVAHTELSRAYVGGKRTFYEDAGLTTWMWDTSGNENVCDECEPMDGEVATIGEPFSGGEDQPPQHPSCACTVIADPEAMGAHEGHVSRAEPADDSPSTDDVVVADKFVDWDSSW
jgi:hypothetical protein